MNISEAAAVSGVNPVTLRYYEKVGLIHTIARSSGGVRNYQTADLEWIEFIKCMRSAGLPIESLIEYTRLYREGDGTAEARKQLLIKEKAALLDKRAEIDQTLARLNKKIAHYDQLGSQTAGSAKK